jgi:hypothetical protein
MYSKAYLNSSGNSISSLTLRSIHCNFVQVSMPNGSVAIKLLCNIRNSKLIKPPIVRGSSVNMLLAALSRSSVVSLPNVSGSCYQFNITKTCLQVHTMFSVTAKYHINSRLHRQLYCLSEYMLCKQLQQLLLTHNNIPLLVHSCLVLVSVY